MIKLHWMCIEHHMRNCLLHVVLEVGAPHAAMQPYSTWSRSTICGHVVPEFRASHAVPHGARLGVKCSAWGSPLIITTMKWRLLKYCLLLSMNDTWLCILSFHVVLNVRAPHKVVWCLKQVTVLGHAVHGRLCLDERLCDSLFWQN